MAEAPHNQPKQAPSDQGTGQPDPDGPIRPQETPPGVDPNKKPMGRGRRRRTQRRPPKTLPPPAPEGYPE